MNYEFNLLNHVGVVAKRVCAAAAETAAGTAAHEGDDNTPSGPTGRGVKNKMAAIVSFWSHTKTDNDNKLADPKNLYIPGFKGILKKK